MIQAYYILCRYSSTRYTQLVAEGVVDLEHMMF